MAKNDFRVTSIYYNLWSDPDENLKNKKLVLNFESCYCYFK